MTKRTPNDLIQAFEERLGAEKGTAGIGDLFCGVDLGTANIVTAVVDSDGNPVAGRSTPARVIRDGVVVDYVGAIDIVRKQKAELEAELGTELLIASAAIPPGVDEGCIKAIGNVVESAEYELSCIVDEPTAAARVLNLMDGAVVDVGGGTTGISILDKGKVVYTADEPTGGHHMTLVLAGARKITYDQAESLKHDGDSEKQVFPIVRPVIEKMASIVERFLEQRPVDILYVVGGACTMREYEQVFEKTLGIEVRKPVNPILVTPLGIALSCRDMSIGALETEAQNTAVAS